MTRCPTCGHDGKIVNECRCDPNNLPTTTPAIRNETRYRIEDCGQQHIRIWLKDENEVVAGCTVLRRDQAALLASDLTALCKEMS